MSINDDDMYEKSKQKTSKSKRLIKEKSISSEDYIPDEQEVDYDIIEKVIEENSNCDDMETYMYEDDDPNEEVVIKGEPVTEEFEEEIIQDDDNTLLIYFSMENLDDQYSC